VLVLLLPPLPPGARVDHAVLAAQTSRGCVWAREVELLLLADVSRTSIEDGCPGRADLFGERRAASATVDPAAALAAIDARVADELAASQTALLVASDPLRELGPRSRAYLREHFAVATTTGRIEVWQRRD